MIALNAHFDGKVLVPDEPLDLKPNQHVRLTIEPIVGNVVAAGKKIEFGKQPGAFRNLSADWDAPLPDDIWDFEEGK